MEGKDGMKKVGLEGEGEMYGICTPATVQDGLALINERLSSKYGSLSVSDFKSPVAAARIVNVLYALSRDCEEMKIVVEEVRKQSRTAKRYENMYEDELMLLQEDLKSMKSQLKIKSAQLRLEQQKKQEAGHSAALNRTRIQKQLATVKQREAHYKHAIRKRDKEIDMLRKRVHQQYASGSTERSSKKTPSSASSRSSASDPDPLLEKSVLNELEYREIELEKECQRLRLALEACQS